MIFTKLCKSWIETRKIHRYYIIRRIPSRNIIFAPFLWPFIAVSAKPTKITYPQNSRYILFCFLMVFLAFVEFAFISFIGIFIRRLKITDAVKSATNLRGSTLIYDALQCWIAYMSKDDFCSAGASQHVEANDQMRCLSSCSSTNSFWRRWGGPSLDLLSLLFFFNFSSDNVFFWEIWGEQACDFLKQWIIFRNRLTPFESLHFPSLVNQVYNFYPQHLVKALVFISQLTNIPEDAAQ